VWRSDSMWHASIGTNVSAATITCYNFDQTD
jgi:hypothetical protein